MADFWVLGVLVYKCENGYQKFISSYKIQTTIFRLQIILKMAANDVKDK